MAKPSIFSRDYERKMRKRRRRFLLMILLIVVIVVGVFLKFKAQDIDFSEIKSKMQAWVDSDRIEEESKDNKKDKEEIKVEKDKDKEENTEEDIKEEKEKSLELSLSDGSIINVNYIEKDGEKLFEGISEGTDMTNKEYNISPSKKQILVKDTKQNISLFDISGNSKDITRVSYTSQAGDVFLKDTILQSYEGYVWQEQPKFIDENLVAYVSQLPYFGSAATNKYIWIYDITNNTENCLWGYTGTNIVVGNLVDTKGLEVNIDGVQYYLNAQGQLTQ